MSTAPRLFHPNSNALVKKHLSRTLYDQLGKLKTATGFTIEKAVASGTANIDSSIGIYAGDSETYTLFDPVFTPIIMAYHGLSAPPAISPAHKDGFDPINLPLLDPENRFIRSTRIRVARCIANMPFPPNMNIEQRLKVETLATQAAASLTGDLAGTYTAFSTLPPGVYDTLCAQKLAFPKGDRFQDAAGINADFPVGRGIYRSANQNFQIWVNEEDHLRIMALSQNSDIAGVFNRLARGLKGLCRHLEFAFDPSLGFLTACPTNIGTAMRAGVHICLEKLEKRQHLLKDIVSRHHLQIRGTSGEKTAVDNAIFDISNARRLGVSANDIVSDLHEGLKAVIQTEQSL
ncbi:MAG: arginine kinase [Desulfobacterales bacterium]|nr:MAG: arginine kinase [Desulfobacterales bacterium]